MRRRRGRSNAGRSAAVGSDDPRERHLRQQLGVVQQAAGAGLHAIEKYVQTPNPTSAKAKYELTVDVDVGEAVEQDRERQRADERLDARPRDAEERLLVADLEVAQGEEVDRARGPPRPRRAEAGGHPRGARVLDPRCCCRRAGLRDRGLAAQDVGRELGNRVGGDPCAEVLAVPLVTRPR